MSLHFLGDGEAPAVEFGAVGDFYLDVSQADDARLKLFRKTVGTKQVVTATVAGTIGAAGAGNVSVVVTKAGMTGSPKTIAVAVANDDTAAIVAGKIRVALAADTDVAAKMAISGAGVSVVATLLDEAANDATFNIATSTGTATGLTAAPTSANTAAGVEEAWGSSAPVAHHQIKRHPGVPLAILGQEGDVYFNGTAWYGPKVAGAWGDAGAEVE